MDRESIERLIEKFEQKAMTIQRCIMILKSELFKLEVNQSRWGENENVLFVWKNLNII